MIPEEFWKSLGSGLEVFFAMAGIALVIFIIARVARESDDSSI